MKKMFMLIILAMSIIMCSVQKTEKSDEKSENNGIPSKLVIGLDDTFAPMGFKNENGEIVGFDIDLAKAAAEIIGVEVEFKSINWDSKILDLNSGNIDLIWNGLTITPDRAAETEMSKPYYSSGQTIVVLKGSSVKSVADLEGKVVGVQSQSSGEESILKAGDEKKFKELKTYAQYDQAFLDLENGRLDGIVVDAIYAGYIAQIKETQTGKDLYSIYDAGYGVEECGIAAKKGRKELIDAINNAIDQLKANGKYDEISKNWFKGKE